MGDFYGTGIEIWARFGPMKKKVFANYEQLLSVIFSCFQGQQKTLIFFKSIVAFALKSCIK